ncbi:glycosyltransferase [Spirulina sp. CS-785/01]|uniref:glycosyltransferase n=1 Tax=Spirulina sp. CS-785/01 TaxID=3021716 RepID=UPI00232D03A4|nr:glycosyltransferase [Spirulina sp. CS-785/01]MDB9313638.1 glycosyltransferase [Spirulina sp. CS-785/01]
MVTVSVIIPIYNGEADLRDLLDCLLKQTYPSDQVEYLLVDNNSSDRTAHHLQQAVQTFQDHHLTLRPLSQPDIQSSYAARNTGIRAAQGQLCAFTDADCRPQPNWLTHLLQPFEKPDIGIVAGEIIALPSHTFLERYADKKDTLSQKHTLNHPFCPYGQTANLAIRRAIFQEVGLFRPYLTTGGDADICWRILKDSQWQIELAPQAIIRHRHRATLAELRSQWRRYGKSNRYLHDLYGVDLMRPFSVKYSTYLLTRWLLKDLPKNTVKLLLRRANLLDMVRTPLDLVTFQARSEGQQTAQLPEKASMIEYF